MIRQPPRSTRTDTLFPSTTLFRSRCLSPLLPLSNRETVPHASIPQHISEYLWNMRPMLIEPQRCLIRFFQRPHPLLSIRRYRPKSPVYKDCCHYRSLCSHKKQQIKQLKRSEAQTSELNSQM